jgi:hypothetical protein
MMILEALKPMSDGSGDLFVAKPAPTKEVILQEQ